MKEQIKICLTALLTLCLSISLTNTADAQADVQSEAFTKTVYNPCTEEYVEITGTFKTVTRFKLDANGIPHWGSATHFANTQGIGQSSGIKYRQVGLGADCPGPPCVGFRTVSIRCAPAICPEGQGTVVYTGVVRQRLVAQGSAPDLIITAFFHITQNANGDISVLNQSIDMEECR